MIDDNTIWDFGTTHNGKKLIDLEAKYLLWYWSIRGWIKDDKYHDYIKSAYNDLMKEASGYIEWKYKHNEIFPTRDIDGKDLTA